MRLETALEALRAQGHVLHPLRPWLRTALEARGDRLFSWAQAALDADALESGACSTAAHRAVRDALDACVALEIDIAPRIPDAVLAWHARLRSGAFVAR